MTDETFPSFAVVGHPNKGKSSIVATLSQDDSVRISDTPGTTTSCRNYPMRVDNEILYNLVDTPGFQRSRKLLHLLKQEETSPADRPQCIRRFIEKEENKKLFPDEHELLTPVVNGAGILYVVDGSVPYGPEYDAELEILRWTGQPRMALINPISGTTYVDEWKAALGQFFSVVRVFDAKMASFEKQLNLLIAFGQLEDSWRTQLEKAVHILRREHGRKRKRAARSITQCIVDMLTLKVEEKIKSSELVEETQERLEREYRKQLQDLEKQSKSRVESIYAQHQIELKEEALDILQSEQLFSEQSWRLFGLSRREILTFSTLGGAAVGGLIDAAAGGGTFLMGTVIGGIVGASTAYFAGDSLVETEILHLPLGKRVLVTGPTKSINFPHVAFGRARLHHYLVSTRTHAQRSAVDLTKYSLPALEDRQKRALESCFAKFRKGDTRFDAREQLTQEIEKILGVDEEQELDPSLK